MSTRPFLTSVLVAALAACTSDATGPEPAAPETVMALAPGESPVTASLGEVMRAEIGGFFRFFVVREGEEVSGYSGSSHSVRTSSGVTNYQCVADLLFGPGVSTQMSFKDVRFSTFDPGPWSRATCG